MVVLKFWKSVLFGLLILIICLMPSAEVNQLDFLKLKYEDLVIHFGMFFIFSFLLTNDLFRIKNIEYNNNKKFLIAFSVSILLGFSTEFLQYLIVVINRTANFFDFLFDTVGTIGGIAVLRFIKR